MRLITTILLHTIFVCTALPQHISIEYTGSPLPDSYKQHIKLFLKHGTAFYRQFGMPDTLDIKLHLFDDKKEWNRLLRSRKGSGKKYSIQPQGIYDTRTTECYVMLVIGMKETNLGVIRHELSHLLTQKSIGRRVYPWLTEGLAEYFQHCDVTKKGLKHSLDLYEKGRLRTMFMLNEIRLEDILDYKYNEFSHNQKTNDQITYIASHALVTFLIDAAPQNYFAELMAALKDNKDTDSMSSKIDKTYPGGLEHLKKDFTNYYK